LPWCHRASPSTTRHESVKSTDADTMMLKFKSVNKFLSAEWRERILKKFEGTDGIYTVQGFSQKRNIFVMLKKNQQ
jgi:hypothetical protein